MPLNQADLDQIAAMIAASRLEQSEAAKCRPDYPHDGKLRYNRGNPGVYVCECGQRYMKDGQGGLRLATQFQSALRAGQ